MAALQHHLVRRQCQFSIHQPPGFGFEQVELREQHLRLARFEVIAALFDFVLMEHVAIPQSTDYAAIAPRAVFKIENVVDVLQVHR